MEDKIKCYIYIYIQKGFSIKMYLGRYLKKKKKWYMHDSWLEQYVITYCDASSLLSPHFPQILSLDIQARHIM